MRRLTRLAVLMAVAIFLTTNLTAQQTTTQGRQQGDYIFGLNGGVAYQQSDVATDLNGFGFGLTYGKNLLYKPHAPFSFDVRSRFQIARSFGTDIRPSLGIANNNALNGENTLDYTGEPSGDLVYANHKTNQVELGMEGVLTLNGLREATGLGISFTGGVGLDWYQTKIDQRDANGLYDYNRVDAGGAKPFNLSQLETIRDGEYETLADGFGRAGKFGIMPSLGIELDYDLTNNLALGVGHRMTFSGTDLLDGQQWTNANTLTGSNDMLHYTSLGLKYRFNQKNAPKRNRQPTIELIEPYGSGLSTDRALLPIKATINRVSNPFDVYLTVNGREQKFNYSNNTLAGQLRLKRGENKIVITANNAAGTAKEIIFITYKTDLTDQPTVIDFGAPELIFITPAHYNEKTTENRINLRAKVRLVDDKRAIELRVNGKKERFDFDNDLAILAATIDLQEGINTIEIKAKNRSGEQQVARTIYRELPIAFPTVNFTSPAYNNAKVDNRLTTVKINLQHIAQSSDIQLLVNNQNEPNFYFDYQNGALKADIELREGRNEVEIIATNKRGEVRDQRTIIYERRYTPTPTIRRPRVTINAPQYRESTTREEMVVIHATLENTFRKSDIRLTNNGQLIYDFDFNPNTGILRHNLYLRAGINQVLIETQNEAGRSNARATINFEVPLPPPPPPIVIIPNVDIYQPRQNDVFEEREVTVKANLSGILNKRDIEFRVNREDCLDFRFNPTNGNFRAKVNLRAGENVIVIKGNNPSGTDRQRITVFHERPHAPVIDLRTPNFATTDKKEIRLKANIQHIDNKRDIQIFLNNRIVSDFRFRDDKLEASLRLRKGNNDLEIIATNKYGETRELKNIDYYLPQSPSITVTNINDNQTFKTNQIEVAATIQHVTKRKDAKLFVNGVLANNTALDGDYFTATIRLKEGRNTLVLKANNEHGKEEVNLKVNYLRPRKVTIDFVSHDSKEEVRESTVEIKANLKHVSDKQDIELTVNNKRVDFTFNATTLKSRVRLKKGRNIIRLVANSNNSTAEEVLTLNYRPLMAKPTIQFVTTTNSKKQTQSMRAKITAQVENVTNVSDLTLTLNGLAFNKFDFEEGKLVATIPLKLGANKITVSAKNEGGITKEKTTITRTMGRPTISKGGKIGKGSKAGKREVASTKSKS